jgi:hypothetical protein
MGLSSSISDGPRQRSHSQVRVPRHSWPHFIVSDSRLPQPGGPPVFISPQEQVGPVIPPGTGFPFRRLLRLAGLRWRYSTLPPHGKDTTVLPNTYYNYFAQTPRKTPSSVAQNARLPIRYLAIDDLLLSACVAGMCLPSRCLAMVICGTIFLTY